MKGAERHQLKEDAYAQTLYRTAEWARANRTALLAGLALVLLIAAVVSWVLISRQSAEQAAADLLGTLEESLSAALAGEPAKRAEAVKKVAANADLIAVDYPNTTAAAVGLLRTGQILALSGSPDQAADYFRRAIESGGAKPGLIALARRGLAEALEASGKFAEASQEYARLLTGTGPLDAQVHWDRGRCAEHLGKADEARAHYGQAVALAPDSIWAKLAKSRTGAEAASLASSGDRIAPGASESSAPKPTVGEGAPTGASAETAPAAETAFSSTATGGAPSPAPPPAE